MKAIQKASETKPVVVTHLLTKPQGRALLLGLELDQFKVTLQP